MVRIIPILYLILTFLEVHKVGFLKVGTTFKGKNGFYNPNPKMLYEIPYHYF